MNSISKNLRLPSLIAGWLLYSSSSFCDVFRVNGVEQSTAGGGISVETDPIYTNGILNYYTKAESDGLYATGTPLYAYSETNALYDTTLRGNFSSSTLLPYTNDYLSLGSLGLPWKELFVSSNSLFIGNSISMFSSSNSSLSLLTETYERFSTNDSFASNGGGWTEGSCDAPCYWTNGSINIPDGSDCGCGIHFGYGNLTNSSEKFRITINYSITNGMSGSMRSSFDDTVTWVDIPMPFNLHRVSVITNLAVDTGLKEFRAQFLQDPPSGGSVLIQDFILERLTSTGICEFVINSSGTTINSLGNLTLGSTFIQGYQVPYFRTVLSNLTFSAIAAGARTTQSVTVAGCKVGDGVTVTPTTIQPQEIRWSGQIFATNVVTIFVRNDDLLATSTPSNGNWRVEVRSY